MGGRARRKLLGVSLIAVALGGCGGSHAGMVTVERTAAVKPIAGSGRALGLAVARALLATVIASNGTRMVQHPPGHLTGPPQTSASPNLVDLGQVYLVRGRPQAALAAIRRDRPRSLEQTVSGEGGQDSGGREVESEWYVGFSAAPQANVASEELLITTVAAPHGQTYLRADAQVVWSSLRSSSERVPLGTTSVLVRRVNLDVPHPVITFERAIARRPQVSELVAATDRLPLLQPGVGSCPAESAGPILYFMFRDRSGRTMATLRQRAGFDIYRCNPTLLSVQGHREPALAGGNNIIALAGRLMGVSALADQRHTPVR